MFTLIAFILTIIGSINWLSIGLLQYDFIAGFFGFQGSIFSRIIYIIFGSGAIYLLIRTLANKGTFKIFERRKKKKKEENSQDVAAEPSRASVEASKELFEVQGEPRKFDPQERFLDGEERKSENSDSLFDEHIQNRH
ncbi:MAG: DUF378 domain-containing protein [Clostridia bacterium]|nr:DUF378 domain-containing protein [Clostridia bacterium]